jgi:hypothetical protein
MTPLTSSALDSLALEKSAMTLWHEFLLRFYDGAAHTVGTRTNIAFPKAALRFQQSALPQPISQGTDAAPGAGITLVWTAPVRFTSCWEPDAGVRTQVKYGMANFLFYCRAKVVETGGGDNSESLCRRVSDLLFGLLSNGHATMPLAAKGITQIRPNSPVAVSGAAAQDHSVRLVSCRAKLRVVVGSQVDSAP